MNEEDEGVYKSCAFFYADNIVIIYKEWATVTDRWILWGLLGIRDESEWKSKVVCMNREVKQRVWNFGEGLLKKFYKYKYLEKNEGCKRSN